MNVEMNGESIFVHTGGEPHQADAPAIVFIHGAAMDHTIWTLYARFYAKAGYNVAAIDLPGHGKSGGSLLLGIEEAADFVGRLIDHLQLQSVALVGHSLGSLIALEAAANHASVSRLVMLGTCVPMRVGKPLLDAARNNDHASVDMISLYGHSIKAQLGGNPVAGLHVQNLAERLMEQAADGVMFNDLNACNEYQTGEQAAAQVACPVTLIMGEKDLMTPPSGTRKLQELFARCDAIVLENCGHMMLSEQPEASHRALQRALGYQSGVAPT